MRELPSCGFLFSSFSWCKIRPSSKCICFSIRDSSKDALLVQSVESLDVLHKKAYIFSFDIVLKNRIMANINSTERTGVWVGGEVIL